MQEQACEAFHGEPVWDLLAISAQHACHMGQHCAMRSACGPFLVLLRARAAPGAHLLVGKSVCRLQV